VTLARFAALVIAAALALLPAVPLRAQQPTLDEMLAKGARYVQTFVLNFSNVVAEERYTQERVAPGPKKRQLVSDYFLMSLPGSNDWIECRDVIDVDGKPVGDHENRLLTLVKEGTPATWAVRARAVARASARYNIEDIGTINRPLLTMAFLQRPYQARFEFVLGAAERKLGPDIRLIRFRETQRPAMFAVGPVSGNIWLSEATGAVVKTELQFSNNRDYLNHVVTTFALDPDLGVHVPVQMDDAYAFNLSGGLTEIRGRATYGRFRKFGVKAEETFQQ
jgi:hypothetical protein